MSRLDDALARAQHPAHVALDRSMPVDDSFAPAVPAASQPGDEGRSPSAEHLWLTQHPVRVGDPASHRVRTIHDYSDRLVGKLVTDPGLRPMAVEQYRRLAAALHHAQAQSGIKNVIVTSALMAEGKSLSVCNLGLTLSHSYRMRVLLIDADLRRPSLQELFNLPPTAGLAEGLRAKDERELPLYEVSSGLFVLPAGRPDADPVGGLTSGRFARLIAEATQAFDWILVDTPPLALVPDAALIGSLVDTALLVVRAGASPCALVRQAIDSLGPDKIFGIILNAADTGQRVKSGNYYSYGYSSKAGQR